MAARACRCTKQSSYRMPKVNPRTIRHDTERTRSTSLLPNSRRASRWSLTLRGELDAREASFQTASAATWPGLKESRQTWNAAWLQPMLTVEASQAERDTAERRGSRWQALRLASAPEEHPRRGRPHCGNHAQSSRCRVGDAMNALAQVAGLEADLAASKSWLGTNRSVSQGLRLNRAASSGRGRTRMKWITFKFG